MVNKEIDIPSRNKQRQAPDRTPRLVRQNEGLVVKNIGKRFNMRPVVRDVSLHLNRGEAVGLLGPNGAGKTTCFYIITGLITPNYGSIFLDGTDISELPMFKRARLGIGYLPQEASIFRGLSVEQNIRSILEVTESNNDRCDALLEDLSRILDYSPAQNPRFGVIWRGKTTSRDCQIVGFTTKLHTS